MPDYYDRQGKPLTLLEWAGALEDRTIDKRRVAETTLPNGRWVSTVWLGLDHRFGHGPPLIFESMVFESKAEMDEIDCERYSTEEEARVGHQELVEKWSKAN